MSLEEGEPWVSYVEFGRYYQETHPQYTSFRKRYTTIWLELRRQNGCGEVKYSHKISCRYWPRSFHEAVQVTMQEWKEELEQMNLANPQLIKTKKKKKIFRPVSPSRSVSVSPIRRSKQKKKRKLNLKSKGKDSHYAKSIAYNLEMEDDEIFPVLRKMKKRDLMKYCEYFKLGHSMETHRDKLLTIVTKHFIQRSRMHKNTSIDYMEEDLFWHSIAHQEDDDNQEDEKIETHEKNMTTVP